MKRIESQPKAGTKEYKRFWFNKHRNEIIEFPFCWICNEEVSGHSFHLHEINGIEHLRVPHAKKTIDLYKEEPNRFFNVCGHHHLLIHDLMDFGYSIEEILKILKWEEI